MKPLDRAQAFNLLMGLTPQEAREIARRTAVLAEIHDDLGAGIRGALQEFADALAAKAVHG